MGRACHSHQVQITGLCPWQNSAVDDSRHQLFYPLNKVDLTFSFHTYHQPEASMRGSVPAGCKAGRHTQRNCLPLVYLALATTLLSWQSLSLGGPIASVLDMSSVSSESKAILVNACLGMLFFLLSRATTKFARKLSSVETVTVCGIVLAISLVVLKTSQSLLDNVWFSLLLVGVCSALHATLWLSCLTQYSKLAYSEALPTFLVSQVSSAGISILSGFAFDGYAPVVLTCAMPVVSALVLARGIAILNDRETFQLEDPATVRASSFSVRAIWVMFLFSLVYGYTIYYLPKSETGFASIGGLLGCLAILIACLAKSPALFSEWKLYNYAVPCVLTSLILEFASPFPWDMVSALFAGTGNMLFSVFILVVLADTTYRRCLSPFALFGVAEAARSAAKAIGIFLGNTFTTISADLGTTAFVALAICVAFSAVLLSDDKRAEAILESKTDAPNKPIYELNPIAQLTARCHYLARLHGLTQREEEILFLVAQDISPNDIADKLVLSIHTVRSHTNSVYRKTFTHNRKQLQDYVLNGSNEQDDN